MALRNEEARIIDTYAIQINGSTELVLQGELRDQGHGLGPGGTFTVLNIGRRKLAEIGDKVFIIAIPDAPKTTKHNKDRRAEEKRLRLVP